MIKTAAVVIGSTARDFFKSWRSMAVFNPLYALLLGALYLFLMTKESSAWQLAATTILAVAALVLFFLLLAASTVRYARNEQRPLSLLSQSLGAMWKLVLVSIPLVIAAVFAIYLLNKLQAHFPLPTPAEPARTGLLPLQRAAQKPAIPFSWTSVSLFSLRLIVLGVVLPLVATHVWIATVRNGVVGMLKKVFSIVALAFSAESILIYAIGFLVFGLLPYFLIFTRTPIKNGWAELSIFGLRLALAFILTLWGWIITVGALARASAELPVKEKRSEESPSGNQLLAANAS